MRNINPRRRINTVNKEIENLTLFTEKKACEYFSDIIFSEDLLLKCEQKTLT